MVDHDASADRVFPLLLSVQPRPLESFFVFTQALGIGAVDWPSAVHPLFTFVGNL